MYKVFIKPPSEEGGGFERSEKTEGVENKNPLFLLQKIV